MTRIEWHDLSDSELRLRLENRGVNPLIAYELVAAREIPSVAETIESDCEKLNEAAIAGWCVLRVTTDMVADGRALRYVERALAKAGAES